MTGTQQVPSCAAKQSHGFLALQDAGGAAIQLADLKSQRQAAMTESPRIRAVKRKAEVPSLPNSLLMLS